MQTTVTLTGLTCPACKKLSEKRIGSIAGVTGVEVDVSTGSARIEAERIITSEEINVILQETPYRAIS